MNKLFTLFILGMILTVLTGCSKAPQQPQSTTPTQEVNTPLDSSFQNQAQQNDTDDVDTLDQDINTMDQDLENL